MKNSLFISICVIVATAASVALANNGNKQSNGVPTLAFHSIEHTPTPGVSTPKTETSENQHFQLLEKQRP